MKDNSTTDDLMIRDFMHENRIEIPDNDFSKQVMHRIPNKAHHFSVVWNVLCCLVIGICCTVFGLFNEFFASIYVICYNLLEYLSSPLTLVLFSAGMAITLICCIMMFYYRRSDEF